MKKIFTLFLSFTLLVAAQGQMRYFYGVLSGANENPANASPGGGVVMAKYNTVSKLIELYGNYNALMGTATASHIHTGAAGVNGGILIGLTNTGGVSGNLTGSGTLDGAGETNLFAGSLYVNVHSSSFGGGELRAQLSPVAEGDGVFLNARLQGAQENLPTNSTGSGIAQILLQKSTRNLFVTGQYTGLSSNISNAHIHGSRAGFNGSVILGLTFSGGTAGTLHGSGVITVAQVDSVLNNRTYVNVHSVNFGGGEIRGQATNYSQIRFLGGRLLSTNEVGTPNGSTATGTVIVRYNPETNEIDLSGDYQNLTSNITGSHIHTGAAGVNGDVIKSLSNTGGVSGVLTIKSTLTEPQENDLLAGNLYVNVHSGNNPGGEIRTQLMPTTAGEAQYAEVPLSGALENPPVVTSGFGFGAVLVDKATGQTYISGIYQGMSSNVLSAHLHRSPTGVNGPVIMGLTHTGSTQGTFSGAQILTPSQVDSFVNGLTYLNVHTSNNPSGEIRGQAGNQVLPVRWGSVSGYRQKNAVTILWEALTEENVKQYQLEQQNTVSGNWITKATIPAKGSSPAAYKTEDIPTSFGQEYVHYRIKSVDRDGAFSWSKLVRINMANNDESLIIMGNPVTNTLRFRLAGNVMNDAAEAVIVDMQGRVYSQTALPAGGGYQSISISSLAAGLYILQVKTGEETMTRKFVKQ